MISIDFQKNDGELMLICSGHAEFNCGNDIVCAAVSALCGALAATLLRAEDKFEQLTVAEDAGETVIICSGQCAEPYFEVVVTGLEKIAEAYPFNVRMTA